ncbi:MAG TPA: hypothetical protein ENK98_02710, partial [Epsilonproteobacteria bacterium]|nr:hypothetical protein [Campylobacterota bacterium]
MINIVKDLFLWVLYIAGLALGPVIFFGGLYLLTVHEVKNGQIAIVLFFIFLIVSPISFLWARHKERKYEAAYSKVKNALKGLKEFNEAEK